MVYFNILVRTFVVYAFLPVCVYCTLILASGNFDTRTDETDQVIYLGANDQHLKQDKNDFTIFCYSSIRKSFLQPWRSVYLMLENVPLKYEIFPGVNETEVREKKEAKSFWQPSSWITGQDTVVDFPAFSQYCVGIASKDMYTISLKVRTVNYWRALQTLIGILLFLSAPSLSRNPFFHYTSAVSLGVVGSLLVLIYVLSRFIPKKTTSYLVIFFGYSFVLYILQSLWKDLNEIISNYMDFLLGYCLLTAFISFFVCYRLGPIKNVRTFNVIQWSMQILAVVLIYLSSEYRELSTAVVILLVSVRLIPVSWIAKAQRIWYRFFPPKVRLLSELQYIEQGHLQTRKALEDLRKYCSSPDCNVWKTVTRLKQPLRFAEFIETGSHCSDQELLHYNSEGFDFSEDDSDSETLESSHLSNGIHSPR